MKTTKKKTKRGRKLSGMAALECKMEHVLGEMCVVSKRLKKLEEPIEHWWYKAKRSLWLLLVALCLTQLVGCTNLRSLQSLIAPESDPTILRAEATATSAEASFKALQDFIRSNPTTTSLETHHVAGNLLTAFPKDKQDLQALLKLYKANRSAANHGRLLPVIEAVRAGGNVADMQLNNTRLPQAEPMGSVPFAPALPPTEELRNALTGNTIAISGISEQLAQIRAELRHARDEQIRFRYILKENGLTNDPGPFAPPLPPPLPTK